MKLIECKNQETECNAQRLVDKKKICGAPIPLWRKIKCKPILEEDLEQIQKDIRSKNDEIEKFMEGKSKYCMDDKDKGILKNLESELSDLEKDQISITKDLNNGNYRGMKK